MIDATPYEEYNGKFCKVIISTDTGDKALKGIISIFEHGICITGDYQKTTVAFSQILRITTKQGGENKE